MNHTTLVHQSMIEIIGVISIMIAVFGVVVEAYCNMFFQKGKWEIVFLTTLVVIIYGGMFIGLGIIPMLASMPLTVVFNELIIFYWRKYFPNSFRIAFYRYHPIFNAWE